MTSVYNKIIRQDFYLLRISTSRLEGREVSWGLWIAGRQMMKHSLKKFHIKILTVPLQT